VRRRTGLLAASLLVAGLATAGCSGDGSGDGRGDGGGASTTHETSRPTDQAGAVDPDTPLPWGPTVGELDRAHAMVAGWSASRLAGQVIVGRYDGYDPEVPAGLVRDLHLAGVCITSDNVTDADQVRATTRAITDAVAQDGRDFPAVIGVDEEGGSVEHLSGIATTFPAFADAGAAITADPARGRAVVREAAAATALELRGLGFTWVFAPDADVTIGAADPTIGDRSPSMDPQVAAQAVTAAIKGYDGAGLVSTPKHFPGHGAVTVDSHEALPVRDVPLEEIRSHDLPPFEAAIRAGAPAVMVGHIEATAIDPTLPASLSPKAYAFLRDDLGFRGLTITDSLGMGAVATAGFPAVKALNAGADLLLMPADTVQTHAVVTKAITDGTIERRRAENAAAMVVALQLWQQRVADGVPVPADVTARAQQAAANLASAG
jgi:beta-N-acetylhexosaminidase